MPAATLRHSESTGLLPAERLGFVTTVKRLGLSLWEIAEQACCPFFDFRLADQLSAPTSVVATVMVSGPPPALATRVTRRSSPAW